MSSIFITQLMDGPGCDGKNAPLRVMVARMPRALWENPGIVDSELEACGLTLESGELARLDFTLRDDLHRPEFFLDKGYRVADTDAEGGRIAHGVKGNIQIKGKPRKKGELHFAGMRPFSRSAFGFYRLSLFMLAGFAGLALSGCAFFRLATSSSLKKPTFAYASHEVTRVELAQTDLLIRFKAKNPNAVGLKNVFVSYELFTQGKRFLRGDSVAVDLAPQGESNLAVPAQVIYADVLRALGPAAEKILSGSKTLPVTIHAQLSGKPTLYNEVEEGGLFAFTLNLTHTVDVPIPREAAAKEAEKQIRRSLRKMF